MSGLRQGHLWGLILGLGLIWGAGSLLGQVSSEAGLNWAGSSLGQDLIKARVKPRGSVLGAGSHWRGRG